MRTTAGTLCARISKCAPLYRWLFRMTLPLCFIDAAALGQTLPREAWGAPAITVAQANNTWTISGRKNRVTLTESNLALVIHAGPAEWKLVPSGPNDMLVRHGTDEFSLQLAGAEKREVVRYDTGYKAGGGLRPP
jgi:hypothetical protein